MNKDLMIRLEALTASSTWGKGVKAYALELAESAEVELTRENVSKELLNGADNWNEYSYGGCALIYDSDIAERLAGEGILKVTKNGEFPPNDKETWLDAQARALKQAYGLIIRAL